MLKRSNNFLPLLEFDLSSFSSDPSNAVRPRFFTDFALPLIPSSTDNEDVEESMVVATVVQQVSQDASNNPLLPFPFMSIGSGDGTRVVNPRSIRRDSTCSIS